MPNVKEACNTGGLMPCRCQLPRGLPCIAPLLERKAGDCAKALRQSTFMNRELLLRMIASSPRLQMGECDGPLQQLQWPLSGVASGQAQEVSRRMGLVPFAKASKVYKPICFSAAGGAWRACV